VCPFGWTRRRISAKGSLNGRTSHFLQSLRRSAESRVWFGWKDVLQVRRDRPFCSYTTSAVFFFRSPCRPGPPLSFPRDEEVRTQRRSFAVEHPLREGTLSFFFSLPVTNEFPRGRPFRKPSFFFCGSCRWIFSLRCGARRARVSSFHTFFFLQNVFVFFRTRGWTVLGLSPFRAAKVRPEVLFFLSHR